MTGWDIGEKGLRAMKIKGIIECFPKCGLEVDFCENCIYGIWETKSSEVPIWSDKVKWDSITDA
jgi:hypothetical protein